MLGVPCVAEDGDTVADFIDDPELIIGSRTNTRRLQTDGDLAEPDGRAAGEVKDGHASIR